MKILHLLATGDNGGIESLVVDYQRHSQLENIYVFAWSDGVCGERLRQCGAKVYLLQSAKKGNLSKILEIRKICRKENPDSVVVQHGSPLLRLATTYLQNYKVYIYQHYYWSREDFSDNLKCRIRRLIDAVSFSRAHGIIAITNAVKSSLTENFDILENKINVIYNGIDVEKFKTEPHRFDGTVHFCFVGRLTKVKGVQIMLQALHQISDSDRWDYTVIGDGPELTYLKNRTNQMGLHDRVTFKGNCNHVSDEIGKYDVFVHSCIWDEGFGIGVVEAMAAGKLCIATASGGLPEIIEHGVDGILFEKGNVDELASILRDCIEHPERWLEMQNNAVKKAEKFSIEAYTSRFESYLQMNGNGGCALDSE